MPFSQSKKPGALQLFAYILKPKKWYLPRIPAFSGGLFGSGKAKGQPHKRLTCKFDGANGRTRTGDPRITNALLYQLSHVGTPDAKNKRHRSIRNDQLFRKSQNAHSRRLATRLRSYRGFCNNAAPVCALFLVR